MSKTVQLCWQCNKKLMPTFTEIEFNGSKITVHKTCAEDAKNLLFENRVTFMGINAEAIAKREGIDDE